MPCPFCNSEAETQTDLYGDDTGIIDHRPRYIPDSDNAVAFGCPDCGHYIVTKGDMERAFDGDRGEYRVDLRRIACLLCERRLQGHGPAWLRATDTPYIPLMPNGHVTPAKYVVLNVRELLHNWPKTTGERVDRALLNLARKHPNPGENIKFRGERLPYYFATDNKEANFVAKSLEKRNLIDGTLGKVGAKISYEGWEYVDRLSRTLSSPQNPAFVAMWFGSDEGTQSRMREVFERGMAPAAEAAGYEAKRVDSHEFNDDIMDQVISRIRVAPFVIADYTGQRGGVYYEAGFARGLGIPVINTCSKEESKNLHFDVKQLNFIMWESPEDLCKRLQNRITATIGRGPHTFDDKVGKA